PTPDYFYSSTANTLLTVAMDNLAATVTAPGYFYSSTANTALTVAMDNLEATATWRRLGSRPRS
ncbi:hypothetical protein T484DRAFT_1794843, partial [Baffinella frigidus]